MMNSRSGPIVLITFHMIMRANDIMNLIELISPGCLVYSIICLSVLGSVYASGYGHSGNLIKLIFLTTAERFRVCDGFMSCHGTPIVSSWFGKNVVK